jgi:eukaryotic-like serine/threonine-protein kinase
MDGADPSVSATSLWRRALDEAERLERLDAAARAHELEALQAESPALQRRVRELLADDIAEPETISLQGREIGPWRITRLIGRGGMGEVWRAERSDGRFEGAVAVKLLRGGGTGWSERFRREGRVLGRLTHPNIARLLDAGTLADGQPYLVLEHVEGERIDAWCDARRLGTHARVRLLLQVCDAVAHAHANLVVHRDLKPSNILVDGSGQAKLLDFGIAKLVAEEDAEASVLTHEGAQAMTPPYAAPEQVNGGAVTTATDVYALGLLLFRLLSGGRPYGEDGLALAQWAR